MESYRTHYSKDVSSKDYGKNITVAGWIEDIRNIGSIGFIIIRDKKGTLQVTVFKKENAGLFEKMVNIPRESVVSVNGLCKESKQARNGYEVIPKEFEVLSVAEVPLPLGVVDKVESELDTRLDNRFIDFFNQKAVKNCLACIIRYVKNILSLCKRFTKLRIVIYCKILGKNRFEVSFQIKICIGSKIDDITCNREPYSSHQSIFGSIF